jgi:hypothetical protein
MPRPRGVPQPGKAKRLDVRAGERAFITAFLAGPPGVRFRIQPSIRAAGYRDERPRFAANLLRRPSVQRLMAEHARQHGLTVEKTLTEWQRLAFSDLRTVATWDADGLRVIPSAELTDEAAAALAEVVEHTTKRISTKRTAAVGVEGQPGYQPPAEVETVTVERHLKVKLHSKVDALTAISKYLGVLRDRADDAPQPVLPRGFFAAIVLGDVSKIQGYMAELGAGDPAADARPVEGGRLEPAPSASEATP